MSEKGPGAILERGPSAGQLDRSTVVDTHPAVRVRVKMRMRMRVRMRMSVACMRVLRCAQICALAGAELGGCSMCVRACMARERKRFTAAHTAAATRASGH